MANIRTLKLNLLADVDNFSRGLETSQDKMRKFGKSIDQYANKAGLAFAGLAAAGGLATKAAAEDQASQVKLAKELKNVINATDATTKAVEDYINKTALATGVADDQLRPAFQRLVRSTKDVTEAQKLMDLALNISAATGRDAESVSMALAKANDGQFGALKKLGITLGDSATNAAELTKENAKLLKAQNDLIYAQQEYGVGSKEYEKAAQKVADEQAKVNAITAEGVDWVGELGKQFGGQMSANADTAAGRLRVMNNSLQEARESIGYALLPTMEKFVALLQKAVPVIQRNADAIGKFGVAAAALLGTFYLFSKVINTINASFEAYNNIVKLAAKSQALFNVILAANPIALTVIALAALGAAFVIAYKKIEPFRNLIDSIWEKIKKLFDAVKSSPIGKFVTSAFEKITGSRAAGGSVSAGQAYRVGEFGSELFVPNSSGRIVPNAGGGNVTVNINGVIDAESARRSIEKLLQDSARRTGAVSLIGATL